MKKGLHNPYKYSAFILAALIIAMMIIRGYDINYSWIYSLLAISIILYCGWKVTVLVDESNGKRSFALFFIIYTFIVSITLGPILYLAIPHFADKYLFANITEIKDNDKRH